MKVTVRTGPIKPKPQEGDIKTCKDGVFVREQRRAGVECGWIGPGAGDRVVSDGRPVFDWKRTGDAPQGFKGRAVIEYKR